MAYGLATLIGATIGGATGAGSWKLFEVHRKQMAELTAKNKENSTTNLGSEKAANQPNGPNQNSASTTPPAPVKGHRKQKSNDTRHAPLNSFVELWGIFPVDGKASIAADQPLSLNITLQNKGPQPAHDIYLYFQITIASVSDRAGAIKKFRENAQTLAERGTMVSLGIGDKYTEPITVPSVPANIATGLLDGTLLLHLFTYCEWKDHQDTVGETYSFLWLEQPKSNQLREPEMLWHICPIEKP